MPVAGTEEGIKQIIRMVLDEQSAKDTENKMQKSLKDGSDPKAAKSNFDRLKDMAVSLGQALAAAFAIHKIIEFGRESVAAALESRKAWGTLSQALENAGVNAENMTKQAKAMAEQFKAAGLAGDEEFARGLTTLTQVSGDAEKSLANMGVVADLAAAKNLSLEESATLVSKAMVGNVTMFQRMGIVIPPGADAVQFLADKFKGYAENLDPAIKQQKRLHEDWDDFKEAVGEVLLKVGQGESVWSRLGQMVRSATFFLHNHEEQIGTLTKALMFLVKGALWLVLLSFEGWSELLARVADGLAKTVFAGTETGKTLQKFADDADRAADATENLRKAIFGPQGKAPALGKVPDMQPGGAVKPAGGDTTTTDILGERLKIAKEILDTDKTRIDQLNELAAIEKATNEIMQDGTKDLKERSAAAELHGNVVAELNKHLAQTGIDAELAQGALEAFVDSGSKSSGSVMSFLAKEARSRALFNVAAGIEELAKGIAATANPFTVALAPAHFKASGTHFLSAAKWGLLSAASIGAGGSFDSSSSGNANESPSGNVGASSASKVSGPNMMVEIHIDGINPDNPDHQARLRATEQNIKDRYGKDSSIRVFSGSGA